MTDQPPFTGAQRQAFEAAVEKAAIEYARRTELRKWCIEQSVEIYKAGVPVHTIDEAEKLAINDPVFLAKCIYDFVRAE